MGSGGLPSVGILGTGQQKRHVWALTSKSPLMTHRFSIGCAVGRHRQSQREDREYGNPDTFPLAIERILKG